MPDVGQLGLASSQGTFGCLQVLDIRAGAIPSDNGSFLVAHRLGTNEEPAIRSIGAAHAGFGFARFFGCQRLEPGVPQALSVVGMDQTKPLPTQRLIERDPRVVEPTFVDVFGAAVSRAAPSHR